MDKSELLARYEARGDEADFVEAKRLYEAELRRSPHDPKLHNDYGYLLECHGRHALRAATEAYRRAIELDPEWAKPRLQLISAAAALREPEEAIELYEARLAALPDDLAARRYLSTAYVVAQRFAEAEAVARDGLRIEPNDARLANLLGEALAGEGRLDDALEAWRRGYELDPETLEGRYGSAVALERAGRTEDALGEWRFIKSWTEARSYALDAEWPAREIARLMER
ncbi:MAG TPA: tetratricopeptide repeat protein [Candidatus Limnocylindrales bacterium]